MQQQYFIVVFAHSLHGRLRRVHIPHNVVYAVLALALAGCFSVFGFVSSYARMVWKTSNYNSLVQEISTLRARYRSLQKTNSEANNQLAQLQLLASEVSMAYGLKQKLEGPDDISSEGRLVPTIPQTLAEYDFLRTANLSASAHRYQRPWQVNIRPGSWPVDGPLRSYFGDRTDPFSGEGAFHTGVDIGAPQGAPVHAAADGVVLRAQWMGGYGRMVIIDHGDGIQTYYAHLSRFSVVPGQEIRQGEVVGLVGATGRASGPHLHYEVRVRGNPENPRHFLNRPATPTVQKYFPF
jgi:murein DD-endopeptidase MepM/ murein hydrolase activator NlpD